MNLLRKLYNKQIYIDYLDNSIITGWAWNRKFPNAPVNVDIHINGILVSTITAEIFRTDLLNAGKGNGKHGFEYKIPKSLSNNKMNIKAKISGNKPMLVKFPPEQSPIKDRGKNNLFDLNGTNLINSNINITGNNNIIKILDSNIVDSSITVNSDNNNISIYSSKLLNVVIDLAGNKNTVHFDSHIDLSNTPIIMNGDCHKLELQQSKILKACFYYEDMNCTITVGKDTTFVEAGLSVAESTNINIGQDCMFSNRISIISSDYHSIIDIKSNKRINHAKSINIGNHVWIGEGARILKGVTVGDNSIIGAGSTIVKSVPANCIAAGSPGVVIKENITWNRERIS